MDGLDRRILAAVTRSGRRLLTSTQLYELGATEKQVLGRVRRGTLQRIHRGVYLVGAGTLSWEERQLAATLAGGPGALASHLGALRLWDAGEFGRNVVQITVDGTTAVRAEGVQVFRTRRLPAASVRRGVPCVGVERALLDAASLLSTRQLHRAFTTAWRRNHTTPRKLLRYLDEHGGKGVRGTRTLRETVSVYAGCERGPGSEAEADLRWDLLARLNQEGIEAPALQHEIPIHRATAKAVVDLAWPERRKVVEMMGVDVHGNYLAQDDDAERAAAIRAEGWDLTEVTPRALRERRDRTVDRIVAFLQS